jgi:hypothetical protein
MQAIIKVNLEGQKPEDILKTYSFLHDEQRKIYLAAWIQHYIIDKKTTPKNPLPYLYDVFKASYGSIRSQKDFDTLVEFITPNQDFDAVKSDVKQLIKNPLIKDAARFKDKQDADLDGDNSRKWVAKKTFQDSAKERHYIIKSGAWIFDKEKMDCFTIKDSRKNEVLGSIALSLLMPQEIGRVPKYRIIEEEDGRQKILTKDLNYQNEHNDVQQVKNPVGYLPVKKKFLCMMPLSIHDSSEAIIKMRLYGLLCGCIDMHYENIMQDDKDNFYAIDFDASLIDLTKTDPTYLGINGKPSNTIEALCTANDSESDVGNKIYQAWEEVLETYAGKKDNLRKELQKQAEFLSVPEDQINNMLEALDNNYKMMQEFYHSQTLNIINIKALDAFIEKQGQKYQKAKENKPSFVEKEEQRPSQDKGCSIF